MPKAKKVVLDTQTQELIWNLLHNENEVIADVLGTEVKLTVVSAFYDDQQEMNNEIETDTELQKMLLDSVEDEKAGRVYSTMEAIKYIRELHAK